MPENLVRCGGRNRDFRLPKSSMHPQLDETCEITQPWAACSTWILIVPGHEGAASRSSAAMILLRLRGIILTAWCQSVSRRKHTPERTRGYLTRFCCPLPKSRRNVYVLLDAWALVVTGRNHTSRAYRLPSLSRISLVPMGGKERNKEPTIGDGPDTSRDENYLGGEDIAVRKHDDLQIFNFIFGKKCKESRMSPSRQSPNKPGSKDGERER